MKLSPYEISIEQAYDALLHEMHLRHDRPDFAFNFIRRRPHHVIPRNQPHHTPPRPVREYEPTCPLTPFLAKEKLVQLAAFEATSHDSITPMTPDMVPLILDTGASVSITPFLSDFITPLQPVQHVTIKGIASGLKAEGIGDVSYTFMNDSGMEQTLVLQNCLYVPQCVVRLICPRQIGATTGDPDDGFYASHQKSVLIVNGHHTTV